MTLTADDLFQHCVDTISSILQKHDADDFFYIGVTETPKNRFNNREIGHWRRFGKMYLVGVSGNVRIVRDVKERLISEWRSLDSNCTNKGKGGERVGVRADIARFIYLVTGSMS